MQQLAQRLDELEISNEAMRLLSAIVAEGSGSFAGPQSTEEASQIQENWESFLAQYEDEIRSGKVFHIGDSEITSDLFPSTFQWYLKDGTTWPK